MAQSTSLPRRALLVIDVQNEYETGGLPIAYPDIRTSLRHIGMAMDGAQAAGIPVAVVQQSAPAGSPIFARGTPGWELHEVVKSRPYDHLVEKLLPSAFADTGLERWLVARGIDTLTIVGFMTHNCDDSTVRHALHAGYAVEVLSDATGAIPYANRAGAASAEEIHRVFMVVMQSRFAAVLSTAEWLDCVRNGTVPPRDTILTSMRQALAHRTA